MFFQRYNAAGTAQGGETRVNTTTTNTQSNPSVAMDPSGNFIVAWAGEGTQAGNADTSGVFFRRYNATGTAQGGETRVNTTTTNTQSNPSVAMDPSGNFIVAWAGEGTRAGNADNSGVFFQRYNAAGAAQGSETRANATTANAQQTATVSMDMNGNFTIAWTAMTQPGETAATWAVVKQDFNSDGTPNGNEIRVNTTSAGDQNAPGVGMNRFGEYVVAWAGEGTQAGNVDTSGVFFQRFVSGLVVDTVSDTTDGTTLLDLGPARRTKAPTASSRCARRSLRPTTARTSAAPTASTSTSPAPASTRSTFSILTGPAPGGPSEHHRRGDHRWHLAARLRRHAADRAERHFGRRRGASGLTLAPAAPDSTIRGFAINRFD